MARGGGGAGVLLVILLGVLAAAGTWNYRRNAELETEVPRPFRSYSSEDLATLLDAHRQEAESLSRTPPPPQAGGGPAGPLIGDKIRAFERVQRRNEQARVLSEAKLVHDVAIAQIEAEQALRRDESDRVKFHLRRLLTLPD